MPRGMRRCREDEVSVVCRNEHGQSDESSDSPGLSSWDFAQGWFATAFQPRLLRVAPPSSEGREGMAGQGIRP
jgi:hypothetical protein